MEMGSLPLLLAHVTGELPHDDLLGKEHRHESSFCQEAVQL